MADTLSRIFTGQFLFPNAANPGKVIRVNLCNLWPLLSSQFVKICVIRGKKKSSQKN
jgi:hypothetical protein